MGASLLNYTFDQKEVSNPDGSKTINFPEAYISEGPGEVARSNYPKSLSFGKSAAGAVAISDLEVNDQRFHIRVIFQIREAFRGRQILVESDHLPFALYLHGDDYSRIKIVASVCPTVHGWTGADTRFDTPLDPGQWYVADLVYDLDTVGLFLNGKIKAVHAFPEGTIDMMPGSKLYIGTGVNGQQNYFDGKIAALQFNAGITYDLESQLDSHRYGAQWHITYKSELLKSNFPSLSQKRRLLLKVV